MKGEVGKGRGGGEVARSEANEMGGGVKWREVRQEKREAARSGKVERLYSNFGLNLKMYFLVAELITKNCTFPFEVTNF